MKYTTRVLLAALTAFAGCEKPKTYTAHDVRREPIPFGSAKPERTPSPGSSTLAGSPEDGGLLATPGPASEAASNPFQLPKARPSGSATPGVAVGLDLAAADLGFTVSRQSLSISAAALARRDDSVSTAESTRQELEKLFNSGVEHLQQGQFDRALYYFEKMQTTDPRDVRGYLGTGETYLRRNDVGRALAVLEIGGRTFPDDESLNFCRARAYMAINDFSRAYENLSKVLARAPDNAEARLQRCVTNLRRRNATGMIEDAEALIRLLPNNPEGYLLKAIARGMAGDLEAGRKLYLESERRGLPKNVVDIWRPQFFPPGVQ